MLRRFLSLLPVLCLAVGCSSSTNSGGGGAGGATRADELREVGALVSAHAAKGRKSAPTPAQLTEYEQTFPLAVKAIRSGTIEVVWGVKPTDEEAVANGQGGTEVIAHEKKAATEGGEVLLQNGEVKVMTAAEFANAKKPGTK